MKSEGDRAERGCEHIGINRVEFDRDELVEVERPSAFWEASDWCDVLADPGRSVGAGDRLGKVQQVDLRVATSAACGYGGCTLGL